MRYCKIYCVLLCFSFREIQYLLKFTLFWTDNSLFLRIFFPISWLISFALIFDQSLSVKQPFTYIVMRYDAYTKAEKESSTTRNCGGSVVLGSVDQRGTEKKKQQ